MAPHAYSRRTDYGCCWHCASPASYGHGRREVVFRYATSAALVPVQRPGGRSAGLRFALAENDAPWLCGPCVVRARTEPLGGERRCALSPT